MAYRFSNPVTLSARQARVVYSTLNFHIDNFCEGEDNSDIEDALQSMRQQAERHRAVQSPKEG